MLLEAFFFKWSSPLDTVCRLVSLYSTSRKMSILSGNMNVVGVESSIVCSSLRGQCFYLVFNTVIVIVVCVGRSPSHSFLGFNLGNLWGRFCLFLTCLFTRWWLGIGRLCTILILILIIIRLLMCALGFILLSFSCWWACLQSSILLKKMEFWTFLKWILVCTLHLFLSLCYHSCPPICM